MSNLQTTNPQTAIVVPLRSIRRERALLVQKLQHAIPAVGLLFAGLESLRHGPHGFELALALVEVVTSGLLIATIARSVKTARAAGRSGLHHAHGIDWIDVWAAGVLFAEAGERWHLTRHVARPTILTALVTLGLGLFHGRLSAMGERRRVLRIDDHGIVVGGKPFRTFQASWKEIADITITAAATEARIRTTTGRTRRLVLSDLDRPDEVRRALEEARRRLAVGLPDERTDERTNG